VTFAGAIPASRQLSAGPTRDVLRLVVNNEADLAYVNGPAPTTSSVLAVDVACPSSLMGFWPRTFGSAPKVVRAKDLVDKPFIYYTRAPSPTSWFTSGFTRATASRDFDGVRLWAKHSRVGRCWTRSFDFASEVVRPGALLSNVIVRPIDPSIPTQLYVAIHKDKLRHEALRVVHAALLAVRISQGEPSKRSKRS
jgi:DNA-binding transcriptional LysR family regulator